MAKSPTVCANPSRNPLNEARFFVKYGNLQGCASVCVAGQQVSSCVNKQCQSLRPRVPLGRIMDGSSATGTVCVDICAVRDQPRHGSMVPLMCECLQKGASSVNSVVDGKAKGYECLSDIVCPPAVTLKMAERGWETHICGCRSLVQQPADEHKVFRRPTGAEQRRRITDSSITRERIQICTVLRESQSHFCLNFHSPVSVRLPVGCTRDVERGHSTARRFHIGGQAGVRTNAPQPAG